MPANYYDRQTRDFDVFLYSCDKSIAFYSFSCFFCFNYYYIFFCFPAAELFLKADDHVRDRNTIRWNADIDVDENEPSFVRSFVLLFLTSLLGNYTIAQCAMVRKRFRRARFSRRLYWFTKLIVPMNFIGLFSSSFFLFLFFFQIRSNDKIISRFYVNVCVGVRVPVRVFDEFVVLF